MLLGWMRLSGIEPRDLHAISTVDRRSEILFCIVLTRRNLSSSLIERSLETPHIAVPTSEILVGFLCQHFFAGASRRDACVGRAVNKTPARGISPPAICGFEPPDFLSAIPADGSIMERGGNDVARPFG